MSDARPRTAALRRRAPRTLPRYAAEPICHRLENIGTKEMHGLDIEIIAPIAINEDLDQSQPREKHVRVHLLLARTIDGDPTISDRPWKWIPLSKLNEHEWPRANTSLIEALKQFLPTMKA